MHHWWKLARDVRPPQSLYAADFTKDFFQERFPFVDGCTTGPSWLFFSLSKIQNSPETWACFSAAETCSWAASKKHTTFFFKGRSTRFSGGSPFGIPASFFKFWTFFLFFQCSPPKWHGNVLASTCCQQGMVIWWLRLVGFMILLEWRRWVTWWVNCTWIQTNLWAKYENFSLLG